MNYENNSLSLFFDAIRPRRGFQDTQQKKQVPKQQQDYYVAPLFVLDRFGCCCSRSCSEQASELSVGFDVFVWPMLPVFASSSSPPPFAPLSDSAIRELTASLCSAASDSNDRIVVVLEPAAATTAAKAQCKFVAVVVNRDDATLVVYGLRHGFCVVFFAFKCRSNSSRSSR